MNKKPLKIFISYSHLDTEYLELLQKQLEILYVAGVCLPWDDRHIKTGTLWQKELETILQQCTIAVLMVSQDFLKSDFIMKEELPVVQQRYERGDIQVLPLIVNPCAWQENPFLKSRQCFPTNNITLATADKTERIELVRQFSLKIATLLENNEPIQPCLLFTPLPPRVIPLIGREEELAALEIKLKTSERVVLVNGLGGIGKTEVCKTFFMNHYTRYCCAAWVDWDSSVRQSLVSALGDEAGGFIETNQTETEAQRFKKILATLRQTRESFLLVLDNIENPEDPDLLVLAGLSGAVKILASSRSVIEGYEPLGLDFLNPGQCQELFYRFYTGQEDDEAVAQVVELCGYHTLTVELVAKTAFYAGKSIGWLYETLKERGFNLSGVAGGKIKTFWHNEREKKPFFDHLVKVFDISAVTAAEMAVLGNVSLLPAVYIPMVWVQEWLELPGMEEINGLVERGWFKRDDQARIYMHPVIQEVVRYLFKPNAEKCRALIVSLTDKLNQNPGDNPLDKKEFVPFGESVVRGLAAEEKDEDLANLANNLSMIFKAMGQLKRALEFQLKDILISEKILGKNHPDLAQSYNNVSSIYQDMGQLERALEFQLKALTIREKILGENHPDLAQSYNNVSLIYLDVGQLELALEFQLKALTIQNMSLRENHPDLATSYNNLSLIYQDMGRLEDALKFQLKDIQILEESSEANHPYLATSYNNISTIYQDMGHLKEALEFQLKAITIREKILGENHPKLATSYNNISTIYRDMSQLERALEFQLKALTIQKKILGENHPDLAASYHNLSALFAIKKDYLTALTYSAKAVAIMKKLFPGGHPDRTLYEKNLEIIEGNLLIGISPNLPK